MGADFTARQSFADVTPSNSYVRSYPEKRTFVACDGTSALGQKQTSRAVATKNVVPESRAHLDCWQPPGPS